MGTNEVNDIREQIAEYLCEQDLIDWEWLKTQPADPRRKNSGYFYRMAEHLMVMFAKDLVSQFREHITAPPAPPPPDKDTGVVIKEGRVFNIF